MDPEKGALNHRYVTREMNCFGVESSIADRIQRQIKSTRLLAGLFFAVVGEGRTAEILGQSRHLRCLSKPDEEARVSRDAIAAGGQSVKARRTGGRGSGTIRTPPADAPLS